MARYLVTGAAGFIASKVCELLLERGDEIVGVDNVNDAYDVRLKQWRLEQLLPRERFDFRKLDIFDRAAVASVFEGAPFDGVVNLAARAGVRQSVADPWIYYDTNTTGTLNLLELCRAHGVKKFVLASTSSLYGAENPMPYSENADTNRPLSPYAASKKAAETLCYTYHYLYGLDVTICRYFTVYGPGGRPDMSLFRFVQWVSEEQPVTIYGDGKQSRDFTYVDDIARGTIAALRPLGYEVVNLGSDEPVVLLDALHMVERLVGKEARIEHRPMHRSDVPATWADVSKARRLLDWEPRVPTAEGIERLVRWYERERAWASQIRTE